MDNLKIQFDQLKTTWQKATSGSALITRRYNHEAYKAILLLTPPEQVVQLLLHELETNPDYWFHALRALSKVDPAKDCKSFDEAIMKWLEWGRTTYKQN